jgi:hypothetical protein
MPHVSCVSRADGCARCRYRDVLQQQRAAAQQRLDELVRWTGTMQAELNAWAEGETQLVCVYFFGIR